MLGDIIYEQKGKISGYRILDVEGPTIETSITGTGIINGIEVSDIVTYWSKPSSYQSSIQDNEKTFDAEGQGVILTKDGEMATWKGYGIERYNGRNRTDRGSVFFKASNGKLAFLNNKIGVFEYEADDENGNTNGKIWEWK